MPGARPERARAALLRHLRDLDEGAAPDESLGAWDEELDDLRRQARRGGRDLGYAALLALAVWAQRRVAAAGARFAAALEAQARAAREAGREATLSHLAALLGRAPAARGGPRPGGAARGRAGRQSTAIRVSVRVASQVRAAVQAQAAASKPDPLGALDGALDGTRWQVERVAETEGAGAFNGAAQETLVEASMEDPALRGMLTRWTERVTDAGQPMDKRVGKDSIAMHAQLAPPGGDFAMPPDAADYGVGNSLLGRSWPFPPNRPHDRCVITPWLPGLGIPGWVWRDGRRWMR